MRGAETTDTGRVDDHHAALEQAPPQPDLDRLDLLAFHASLLHDEAADLVDGDLVADRVKGVFVDGVGHHADLGAGLLRETKEGGHTGRDVVVDRAEPAFREGIH